jgi:hypothetical protein
MPSDFTVTNSPITGSGTLAVTRNSETQNTFLAAPNGSAGTPTYRAIVAADIPTLNQSTTGSAASLSGTPNLPTGTTVNATPTTGDNSTKVATTAFVAAAIPSVPITEIDVAGSAVTPSSGKVNFAAGTNVTLTPSGNTVTIAATSGGSSLTLDNNGVAITPSSGVINLVAGTNMTLTTSGNQVTFASSGTGGSSTLAGDTDVSITSPANGQVLTYVASASKWENQAAPSGSGTTGIFGNGPDVVPTTAGSLDDEFDGTTLNTSRWTAYNGSNSITASVAKSWLSLSGTGSGMGGYEQTMPTGVWEATMKCMWVSGAGVGFYVRDSSTTKIQVMRLFWYSSAWNWDIDNWSNPTTEYGRIAGWAAIPTLNVMYFRLHDDTTNFTYSISYNGASWITLATVSRTSYLANPDRIGILFSPGGSTGYMFVEWFRRTV